MADNWLEKREQQLSGGKVIYRKDNPSLETLLHRLVAQESTQTDAPKWAQLEAIARSARIIFPNMEIVCDEATAEIRWDTGNYTENETRDNSGDNPGDNPEDNPEDNPGNNPGDNSGNNPEDNPGNNPEDNSGDNPGNNPGNNPRDNSGDNPGNNPGDNSGDNPGNNTGRLTAEQTGAAVLAMQLKACELGFQAERCATGLKVH